MYIHLTWAVRGLEPSCSTAGCLCESELFSLYLPSLGLLLNPCKLIYMPSKRFEAFMFSICLITKDKEVKEITLVGLAVSSLAN